MADARSCFMKMFTTAAQLLDLTDSMCPYCIVLPKRGTGTLMPRVEKLVVVLRDGRKLIGVLRSWDQFGTYFFSAGTR